MWVVTVNVTDDYKEKISSATITLVVTEKMKGIIKLGNKNMTVIHVHGMSNVCSVFFFMFDMYMYIMYSMNWEGLRPACEGVLRTYMKKIHVVAWANKPVIPF